MVRKQYPVLELANQMPVRIWIWRSGYEKGDMSDFKGEITTKLLVRFGRSLAMYINIDIRGAA
jgi:hypothetical protein